jgi:hypothetical protein
MSNRPTGAFSASKSAAGRSIIEDSLAEFEAAVKVGCGYNSAMITARDLEFDWFIACTKRVASARALWAPSPVASIVEIISAN